MHNFKLHGIWKLDGFPIADDNLQWNEITWRQSHPASSHKQTRTIYYRMPKEITEYSIFNDLTAQWSPSTPRWAIKLVDRIVEQLGWKELGRVMLVNLPNGGVIDSHTDEGVYSKHYNRVHLILKGGCEFECGGEIVEMRSGTLWEFNHRLPHSVANNSGYSRVSLIVDGV